MRITVFHNPKAGGKGPSRKEIVDALLSAGHAAAYKSTETRISTGVLPIPATSRS